MNLFRLFVLFALLLPLFGCAESLPATVSGTITLDGSPMPDREGVTGNVVFYPVGGGAAAFGQVTSGGKYNVTTGGTKGLEPGEYKVTVRVVEIPPEPPEGFDTPPGQKVLTPAVYSDTEKTELKVTVEPGSNQHDFEARLEIVGCPPS